MPALVSLCFIGWPAKRVKCSWRPLDKNPISHWMSSPISCKLKHQVIFLIPMLVTFVTQQCCKTQSRAFYYTLDDFFFFFFFLLECVAKFMFILRKFKVKMESLIQRQQSVATYQESLQLAFTEGVSFEEAVEICGPSGCQEGQVFKPVWATFKNTLKWCNKMPTTWIEWLNYEPTLLGYES